MRAPLPAGYRLLSRSGVRGFAWDGATGEATHASMEWLEETLARHGTLSAWADAEGCGVELARGRAAVHAVPAPLPGPDGRSRWVVRHYRRGGVVAAVLGDRYVGWGVARPFHELAASVAARDRGVRTPAVVAGATYRDGAVYRADLVTEEVADARSLAAWLRDPSADVAEDDLLRRTGRAVRSLERARLVHADASAGNFVLGRDGPAWIVDLDRCRVVPLDAPPPPPRMRTRLERSLRKIYAARNRPLAASSWYALRAGYEEAP